MTKKTVSVTNIRDGEVAGRKSAPPTFVAVPVRCLGTVSLIPLEVPVAFFLISVRSTKVLSVCHHQK